ncbi:hypothetical protein ACWCO9_07150 [Streptomyces sp. NPDC001937]
MDESLSFESFLEGAKKAAHKAMDDHGRGEYDEFALHAGVAVEKLAKAALVAMNPIYIVEMRSGPEMLFHLGGHRTASKVRTIGASEAIARARTLDILLTDRQLDLLIDLRNGVAHTTSGEQAKSLLPTLAQTVETLLADLSSPLDAFWERWTTTARLAVDRKRSQMYRDVQVRIRQARHVFEDRFAGLPDHVMDRTQKEQAQRNEWSLVQVEVNGRPKTSVISRERCPACSCSAHVLSIDQADSGDAQFDAFALKCPMCQLALEGQAELLAAGLNAEALRERVAKEAAAAVIGSTYRPVAGIDDLFSVTEGDD